jgi:hypothetical protein
VTGSPAPAVAPAPTTGQSVESEATRNETPGNRNPFGGVSSAGTSVNLSLSQLEKARSMSTSAGPPSPSVMGAPTAKTEDTGQTVPVITRPQPTPTTFQHFVPVVMNQPGLISNGTIPQYQQPPPEALPPPPPPPKRSATDILEAQKYRPQPISKYSHSSLAATFVTHRFRRGNRSSHVKISHHDSPFPSG